MTRKILPILIALGLGAGAAGADSRPPARLSGELFIAGRTLIDPPPGERSDSHAYLTITGAAARELYAAMPGKPAVDACRPERRMKSSGNLRCSVAQKNGVAECDFAIELQRGRLAGGAPC